MNAEIRPSPAKRTGNRMLGVAILGIVAGIVFLIVMLAFFGSSADGEPSASIDLVRVDSGAAAKSRTFHLSAISLFAAA